MSKHVYCLGWETIRKVAEQGTLETSSVAVRSGAPRQPTASPAKSGEGSHETKSRARNWLINGGGGHEDGEDGIRALTIRGEALVETLEAYDEFMQERLNQLLDAMARRVVEEAAELADKMCAAAGEILQKKHDDDAAVQYDTAAEICEAIRALLTPAKRRELREVVQKP